MTKDKQQPELVDRLRDRTGTLCVTELLDEAANELEAAYHDIDRQMTIANAECNRAESLLVENERLERALRKIVDFEPYDKDDTPPHTQIAVTVKAIAREALA